MNRINYPIYGRLMVYVKRYTASAAFFNEIISQIDRHDGKYPFANILHYQVWVIFMEQYSFCMNLVFPFARWWIDLIADALPLRE